jgi:membrane protein
LTTFIQRIRASLPGRIAARYGAAKAGTWAIVLAWNGLFAFFPIVIVAVTLLGVALRGMAPDAAGAVEDSIARSLSQNPQQYADILGIFKTLERQTGRIAVVGIAGLLWSGTALTGALDQGLNALYPCKPRSFVRQKLMSVQVILLFTVLMVPLMLSSAVLSRLSDVPHLPSILTSGPVPVALQFAVGSLDAALLFAALYRMVPYRHLRFRRVIPGALTSGLLLETFTLAFPVYARLSHGFSTYGATFALFLLLLAYFYIVGQIIMVGATVNAELDPDPGRCVEPETAGEAGVGGLTMPPVPGDGATSRQPSAAS